jgi:flavin-dependent dehydrogenase
MTATIEIVGAGPAGLSAALTTARQGGHAIVFERHADVGQRFHGDFQGLENWTTDLDVLEELESLGIQPTFEHTPFSELVLYDPHGREHLIRTERPFWYLVRRGPEAGTLDQSLKAQALAAGVEIRFDTLREHLPDGGIVAHGPRRVDAIAVGYVFDCDRADGAFAAVSERLAPGGYSYLLICGGKATIASCLFSDFHNEGRYLERTVDFFRDHVGFQLANARRFGGYGNVGPVGVPRKGKMLYVGEAVAFQDALFGFGMRYAMLSGHLAAGAIMGGRPEDYDRLVADRLGATMRTAVVNRYLYEKLGDRGYAHLSGRVDRTQNVRAWMKRSYGPGRLRSLLYPLARRRFSGSPLIRECKDDCDCTWCRCQHDAAPDAADTRT